MQRAQTFLLYSETDCGKTAQLGRLAKWHWDQTGEISRLVSADSGWDSISPDLIVSPDNPEGIIEAWNVQSLNNPWNPIDATTRGGWPKVTRTDEGLALKMIPPKVNAEGKLLASDGKRVVGQMFYEGISTLGNTALFDHIRNQRALGQDVVGKFTSDAKYEIDLPNGQVKEENRSITLAKAAPSHYGQVQDWILLDIVPKSGRLPVARVVWTGHEAKGTDEISGIQNSVLGPATVGKATVDKTIQKFGHAFHLTVATSWAKDAKTGANVATREFRAWFVKHPDEVLTKMSWPTKVSLPLDRSAELLRMFPGGYIPLDASRGIEWYCEFLQQSAGG